MLVRTILHNTLGWQTRRHLVVIESDDWGSIRMPSREVYENFLKHGIRVDRDPYCRYDSLANKEDFQRLFEILRSVKDKNGNPAVITANTCVANPNFEKIRESAFKEYYYEPFTETLKKCVDYTDVFRLWKDGIDAGIFYPQSHGREHLNIKKWLIMLQMGESATRLAFDLGTWGLTPVTAPSIERYYMSAFDSDLEEDIQQYDIILTEGLELFEKIFGYRSKSFIATTYEWSPKIEHCLIHNGVRYLQGEFVQKKPMNDGIKVQYSKRGFQGSRTKSGMIRLLRNCFFEPSIKPDYDWIGECLKRINIAFRCGKAATICSHRLNFIGSIDSSNTDRNLPMLRKLLQEIVKNWSDVEFVTSDQLGDIIAAKLHARE